MVSSLGGEGAGAGWGEAQGRTDPRTMMRMALGLIAVLLIVVAGLALLNSFFVEYAPGDPDTQPGGGEEQEGEDEDEGGREAPKCEDFERTFYWIFVVLAVISVGFFAVAVARREHHGGRIGSSIWGILAVVAAFLTVMAYGGWRIMVALCDGALTCGSANDGTYSSFLFLLVLTLGAIALGIGFSHFQRRNFLGTGWGLLGLLMFLPTVITGFTWFLIRTLCTPDLSCATRDEFLSTLATIFWISLLGALAAVGIGLFIAKRFDHGFFKSGWGVLAILVGVLALFTGAGYLYVDDLKIPGCDEFEIEEPEEQTCEEIRDDIRGRLATGALVVVLVIVALTAIGMVLHREDRSRFWSSIWAILSYIGLGLLVLIGLAYLVAGSMCDVDEDEEGREPGEPGEDDGSSGDGDGGGDGSGDGSGDGGGGGGDGGSGDGGGGGSGPGSGPGGGGGGTGDANPVMTPVEIDPASLTWVLIALLVVVGIAALIVLLRYRSAKGGGGGEDGVPEADVVQARERRDLLQMLAQGRLGSDEAVIAAYRSFLAWAAARDLGVRATETPREHAVRVGAKYAIDEAPMRDFIRAYEIARLSQHKPTEDERDSAIRFARELAKTYATPDTTETEETA